MDSNETLSMFGFVMFFRFDVFFLFVCFFFFFWGGGVVKCKSASIF